MSKSAWAIIAAMGMSLFAACNKVEYEVPDTESKLSFDITVGDLDPETRAVKKGWEEGDVLYLWFVPFTQTEPDLTLTFDGKNWKAGSLRKGCEIGEKGTFNVVYSGNKGVPSYHATLSGGVLYYANYSKGSSVEYVDGNASYHVTKADLQACCESIEYTVSEDQLKASISGWKLLTDFQVTLTGVPVGEYALRCSAKVSSSRAYIVSREGFKISGNSVSENGQGADYYASAVSLSGVGNAVFFFARTNTSDVDSEVSFTLIPKRDGAYSSSNAMTYSPGKKKLKTAGTLQAVIMPYTKFVSTPEAVDLGLSVKWSSFNLGATNSGEYGYLYAFGEGEPKEDYYWDNYKYCLGMYNRITKYCPSDMTDFWSGAGDPDGKIVLDLMDDAAYVKLGGKWRTPTYDEWKELLDKCTWSWSPQKGLYGYTVTSKSNGKSIFLPAAGYHHADVHSSAGAYGYYWSSSVDSNAPYNAWYLYFSSGQRNMTTDVGYRYLGFAIRPVLSK